MFRTVIIPVFSLFAMAAIAADPPPASTAKNTTTKDDGGPKSLSGMSILGNQEAPKALVIVPWKSSQLGDSPGISKQLDDGRQPVDKEVFMRQLRYYDLRTKSK
jgi:hypothetical protein